MNPENAEGTDIPQKATQQDLLKMPQTASEVDTQESTAGAKSTNLDSLKPTKNQPKFTQPDVSKKPPQPTPEIDKNKKSFKPTDNPQQLIQPEEFIKPPPQPLSRGSFYGPAGPMATEMRHGKRTQFAPQMLNDGPIRKKARNGTMSAESFEKKSTATEWQGNNLGKNYVCGNNI